MKSSALDWSPTLLAAAGVPDMKARLLKDYQAAGKTFKVHQDGSRSRKLWDRSS